MIDFANYVGSNFREKLGPVQAITCAAERGLWHEATVLLFGIVESRSPSAEYARRFYDSFLRVGVVYMNPLFYASIVLQLCAAITEEAAIKILEDSIAALNAGTAEAVEAKLALQCGKAHCLLVDRSDFDAARSTLRDVQIYCESKEVRPIPPLLVVQSNLLELEIAWANDEFHSVTSAGMNIYEHRGTKWTAHLSDVERLWTKTALAVLWDPEVIEFGDLLQKEPLVTALVSSFPKAYELLVSMNEGRPKRAYEIIDSGIDVTIPRGNSQGLRQKVLLATLLHYIHRSPREKRAFAFNEIADACSCPLESVEMLLLNALERCFVVGKIDGRSGSFCLENAEPAHVRLDEVHSLDSALTNLIANVSHCEIFLEAN